MVLNGEISGGGLGGGGEIKGTIEGGGRGGEAGGKGEVRGIGVVTLGTLAGPMM